MFSLKIYKNLFTQGYNVNLYNLYLILSRSTASHAALELACASTASRVHARVPLRAVALEPKSRSEIPAVNYAETPGNQFSIILDEISMGTMKNLWNSNTACTKFEETNGCCKQSVTLFKYETFVRFLQIP